MKFQSDILEDSLVRLELLSEKHFSPLMELGLEPSLWKYTFYDVKTKADMEKYLNDAMAAYKDEEQIPLVTLDKKTNNVVGSSRFLNMAPNHRRLEIGHTWVHPQWQRSHINTHAKLLMMTQAFEVWNMNRIEFRTDALNERSRKNIERVGAKLEGTFKEHVICQTGRIRDTVCYAILKTDWLKAKEYLKKDRHS